MSERKPIHAVRIYPLAIRLRKPFEHAAHERQVADPVVVEVELSDGTLGYGETLARPYVTGETPESVVQTIGKLVPDYLVDWRPASFPEALEVIDTLPEYDATGAIITAARAAVELALLDAYSRSFRRPVNEVVGWLNVAGLGPPGSTRTVTYSGVLSGRTAGLARKTRMMWWYGLRDFKLKVGYADDLERVTTVARVLGRSLNRTTTLRVDANAAWTLEQATAMLSSLPLEIIACVEQPLAPLDDHVLPALKQALCEAGSSCGTGFQPVNSGPTTPSPVQQDTGRLGFAKATPGEQAASGTGRTVDFMPDESLRTMDDAQRLVSMNVADRFNIRISKNGGLIPALRLAHFARKHQLGYQLGCMVGETSILSAAGRRFLECMPGVCFAEGSYGRFLLAGDVVSRPLQFGCGGRVTPLPGLGWGIDVQPALLQQHCECGVIEIRL